MALRLDQKTRLMTALPFFAAMESAAVHILAFSARERAVPAGSVLFRAGEASSGGLIVASGTIRLETPGTLVAPASYGAGTLIGEAALVSETVRPATATATEASVVLDIPRALMVQVLEQHPDSASRLHDYAAARLATTRAAIASVG